MENHDIVGYVGVFLISTNLVPQIYYIYTLKNANSISTMSIIQGFVSGCIMGTYGYLINKIPVIISNCCVSCFYFIILLLKYYYIYNPDEMNQTEPIKIENLDIC